ncbi:hypothetical protein AGMMS50256_01650 [Betaproteobacteria bacterium]|nr:hypothetical protein AGMMS50256_01650 [Betaproteobacteria bacterium]
MTLVGAKIAFYEALSGFSSEILRVISGFILRKFCNYVRKIMFVGSRIGCNIRDHEQEIGNDERHRAEGGSVGHDRIARHQQDAKCGPGNKGAGAAHP